MSTEKERKEWANDAARAREYIGGPITVAMLQKLANAVETLLRENEDLRTQVIAMLIIEKGERS